MIGKIHNDDDLFLCHIDLVILFGENFDINILIMRLGIFHIFVRSNLFLRDIIPYDLLLVTSR